MCSDPASPTPPVEGQDYEFDALRRAHGGDPKPPNFVLHRDGKVIGVCLGLAWHPRAEATPGEVWVGRKGDQAKWGVKLAETKAPLPVYVRRHAGGRWHYLGLHEVTGQTTDPAQIRPRLQPPKIVAVAQVVFLRKLPPQA
jgi:hypothetical protein